MSANDELDLAKAKQQESLLIFDHFDETTALRLGNLVANDPLFYAAMPGTTPANADWARRKRNLVNQLQTSSYILGIQERMGTSWVDLMALDKRDHTPHGGCFPIRVRGAGMVATVAVSGLPQRDDHKLAVNCIAELLSVDLGDSAF
jgi:uncharacterized protein (UPF0303 family)